MADVAESTGAPAVDQSGNLTVWWVPTITNPLAPKVTEIGAGKRITYDFVPSGWNPDGDQEITKDDRLTKKQSAEALGTVSRSLSLEYVESTAADSATALLVEDGSGYFVERRGVANSTLIAAGQKVNVYPATVGAQIAVPADGTGKFRIKQKAALGTVASNVSVVAGS